MLKECIETFENANRGGIDKKVIDTYIPKDGVYLIVKKVDGEYCLEKDPIEIKYDKKIGELHGREHIRFETVTAWDYYSQLIDMNKPMDTKKTIHSNNYLSFFVKQDSLTNGKLTEEIIDKYYAVLSNPYLKYTKKKDVESYRLVEQQLGKVDQTTIEEIRQWIKKHIFSLMEEGIELSGKGYLKIFFEAPMEQYQTEGNRYLLPNIYNSSDYNHVFNDQIYGLPNDNMGLNSKKPFLENKSRKIQVPILLNYQDVLAQRKLFNYLSNMAAAGKVNLYFDLQKQKVYERKNGEMLKEEFSGIFLRVQVGKVVQINNVQTINQYTPKLKRPFVLENVAGLDLDEKDSQLEYYGLPIETLEKMRDLVNQVLFNKFLVTNFFSKAEDVPIKELVLKHCLLESRDALFAWFYKGEDQGIEGLLDKVTKQLVIYSISNGYFRKACHQFNLRCSMKDYFKKGEYSMGDIVGDIREKLAKKVDSKEYEAFESDEEYYFAVGQLVSYFISLNKTKKKTHSLANPFFNAKKDEVLKEKLRNFFLRYNYAIQANGMRFNALYGMIQGYRPSGEVNQDMIIAGYIQKSVIYAKKEEK